MPSSRRIVCDCHQVSEAQIEAALARSCRSVVDIGRALGAGGTCGQCRSDIARIVRAQRWRRWWGRLTGG